MKSLILFVLFTNSFLFATNYNCKINDGTNRITKAEVYNNKVVVTYIKAKDIPPYIFRYNPSKGYVNTNDKSLFLNLLSNKEDIPYLIELYMKLKYSNEEISEMHECIKIRQ